MPQDASDSINLGTWYATNGDAEDPDFDLVTVEALSPTYAGVRAPWTVWGPRVVDTTSQVGGDPRRHAPTIRELALIHAMAPKEYFLEPPRPNDAEDFIRERNCFYLPVTETKTGATDVLAPVEEERDEDAMLRRMARLTTGKQKQPIIDVGDACPPPPEDLAASSRSPRTTAVTSAGWTRKFPVPRRSPRMPFSSSVPATSWRVESSSRAAPSEAA